MERRRRRLAVLCAHLRPTQLSASLCSGGGGGAAADVAAAAAAEEEVSEEKGCVFCAIVRGESPAFKVYEDDVVAAMCSKVPFLSNAIMKAAQCDSFNLLVNNGSAAGQVIFHTHFHIIPRKAGDQLWPSESFRRRPLEQSQETIGLANSIKEHLCASPCSESGTEGSAAPKDL